MHWPNDIGRVLISGGLSQEGTGISMGGRTCSNDSISASHAFAPCPLRLPLPLPAVTSSNLTLGMGFLMGCG